MSKWVPIFRPNVPKLREGCFKMSLPEFCTGSSGSTTFVRKRIQLCRTDPGFPTPGVRMMVVNKLPQISTPAPPVPPPKPMCLTDLTDLIGSLTHLKGIRDERKTRSSLRASVILPPGVGNPGSVLPGLSPFPVNPVENSGRLKN